MSGYGYREDVVRGKAGCVRYLEDGVVFFNLRFGGVQVEPVDLFFEGFVELRGQVEFGELHFVVYDLVFREFVLV